MKADILAGYSHLQAARCRRCGYRAELWSAWNGREHVYAAVDGMRRLDACPGCGEWWVSAFHPTWTQYNHQTTIEQ